MGMEVLRTIGTALDHIAGRRALWHSIQPPANALKPHCILTPPRSAKNGKKNMRRTYIFHILGTFTRGQAPIEAVYRYSRNQRMQVAKPQFALTALAVPSRTITLTLAICNFSWARSVLRDIQNGVLHLISSSQAKRRPHRR